MRQFLYTIFITNNHASFHLRWKKKLVKHPNIAKIILGLVSSGKCGLIFISAKFKVSENLNLTVRRCSAGQLWLAVLLNLFHATGPFLYLLKTSYTWYRKRRLSWNRSDRTIRISFRNFVEVFKIPQSYEFWLQFLLLQQMYLESSETYAIKLLNS